MLCCDLNLDLLQMMFLKELTVTGVGEMNVMLPTCLWDILLDGMS